MPNVIQEHGDRERVRTHDRCRHRAQRSNQNVCAERHRAARSRARWIQLGVAFLGLLISRGASATPVISEVLYDAVGSDNGFLFVEIYGTAGESLEGLTLEGVNGSNGAVAPIVSLSGVIPADGVFVVADQDADGLTMVSDFDQLANFDFQNGPDSILLMNGALAIDAVGYGVFAASEIFAGEGSSAADAPAGSSLARQFADLDQNDNSLDFVVLGIPTPGSVNLMPVPEPGTALLTMVGLIGIGALGGRRPHVENLRG
jgi:hypothetical protein